ncbi:MAG TPA: DoxX family protein [Phycisphaerae bacterium]|nr:DoxX family protein [Phycisphaerae bacterium]
MLAHLVRSLSRMQPSLTDLGLLVLRIAFGGMLAGHGFGKLQDFSKMADSFPDPLGIGHRMSLIGAVSGEFFCCLLVMLGLATRLGAIGAAFTMGVAAFIVHGGDPFAKKEMALLYFAAFFALILLGPGRISVDEVIAKKLRHSAVPVTPKNRPA